MRRAARIRAVLRQLLARLFARRGELRRITVLALAASSAADARLRLFHFNPKG